MLLNSGKHRSNIYPLKCILKQPVVALRRFSQEKLKFFSLRAATRHYFHCPVTACVQKGDPLVSSLLLVSRHLHTVSTGLFPAASSVIRPSCGLAAPHLQQLAEGRGP